jgi:hypothetical protein
VIRNAVIHVTNEQPLLADLFSPPRASDLALVCTNLRTMNGSAPVFVDRSDSVFVFPYTQVRFVEVPAAALAAAGGMSAGDGTNEAVALVPIATAASTARDGSAEEVAAPDDEADAAPGAETLPPEDLDQELEIDEDFLRRVRDL